MKLRVRELREERGWNQTVLGYHAGLSPSQISLIETGKRNPSAETLQGIATALGVEVGDLFPKVGTPSTSLKEAAEAGTRASRLDAASVLQHHLKLIEEARQAREAGDQKRLSEIHKRMADEVTSALIRLGPKEPAASKKRRARRAQKDVEDAASEAG